MRNSVNKNLNHKGQSIIEYILLGGIVTIVLVYMGTDFKRGLQSIIKVTADQMGNQQASEQDFGPQSGFLVNSVTNTWASQERLVKDVTGEITTQQADVMETLTKSTTNSVSN